MLGGTLGQCLWSLSFWCVYKAFKTIVKASQFEVQGVKTGERDSNFDKANGQAVQKTSKRVESDRRQQRLRTYGTLIVGYVRKVTTSPRIIYPSSKPQVPISSRRA